jgi:hypothetical protein
MDSWLDAGRGVSEVGRQGEADPGARGASRAETREGHLSPIQHWRNGRLKGVRLAWCHKREEKLAPYRKSATPRSWNN